MRDIVTKVDTAPKTNSPHGTTVRTKTKYKSFEDYARMHNRDADESETCSPTSYMLKSKFKTLDLDKYKGRNECIKDDQESVGSDDSGVGSISETKDQNRYAAYTDFVNGYRKKQEALPKKVVRSEIFIQVCDKDTKKVQNTEKEFILRPVAQTSQPKVLQRQWSTESTSSDGTPKLNLSNMQNFNSIPRKFEPTAYPKPEVAASIVRPVAPPSLSRSHSMRCDESDGGYEIVLAKPKLPPALSAEARSNVRSPVRKTASNNFVSNINSLQRNAHVSNGKPSVPPPPPPPAVHVNVNVNANANMPPPPPPFMPVQKSPVIRSAPVNVAASDSATTRKEPFVETVPSPANPMQMVFDEIKRRNTNLRHVNAPEPKPVPVPVASKASVVVAPKTVIVHSAVKTDEAKPVPPPIPPPLVAQSCVQQESLGMPPPPPPPMLCDASGALRRAPNSSPPQSIQANTTQLLEKERKSSKPAPPPLQQELFKKLSEMNKKNQAQEEQNAPSAQSSAPSPKLVSAGSTLPPQSPKPVLHNQSGHRNPQQKYNTLSRFMDTEKECLKQQQQHHQSSTLERQDPKKKIVYNVYREMLGSYNAKANDFVATLPTRMVREDQGVKKQLESLLQQGGSLDQLTGRVAPKSNQDAE